MELLKFMFVPTILFLLVVAPIWITMHYRSVNRSTRSLNEEDRHSIESMLATVDKLVERIAALEAILDDDHPGWRQQARRDRQGED